MRHEKTCRDLDKSTDINDVIAYSVLDRVFERKIIKIGKLVQNSNWFNSKAKFAGVSRISVIGTLWFRIFMKPDL